MRVCLGHRRCSGTPIWWIVALLAIAALLLNTDVGTVLTAQQQHFVRRADFSTDHSIRCRITADVRLLPTAETTLFTHPQHANDTTCVGRDLFGLLAADGNATRQVFDSLGQRRVVFFGDEAARVNVALVAALKRLRGVPLSKPLLPCDVPVCSEGSPVTLPGLRGGGALVASELPVVELVDVGGERTATAETTWPTDITRSVSPEEFVGRELEPRCSIRLVVCGDSMVRNAVVALVTSNDAGEVHRKKKLRRFPFERVFLGTSSGQNQSGSGSAGVVIRGRFHFVHPTSRISEIFRVHSQGVATHYFIGGGQWDLLNNNTSPMDVVDAVFKTLVDMESTLRQRITAAREAVSGNRGHPPRQSQSTRWDPPPYDQLPIVVVYIPHRNRRRTDSPTVPSSENIKTNMSVSARARLLSSIYAYRLRTLAANVTRVMANRAAVIMGIRRFVCRDTPTASISSRSARRNFVRDKLLRSSSSAIRLRVLDPLRLVNVTDIDDGVHYAGTSLQSVSNEVLRLLDPHGAYDVDCSHFSSEISRRNTGDDQPSTVAAWLGTLESTFTRTAFLNKFQYNVPFDYDKGSRAMLLGIQRIDAEMKVLSDDDRRFVQLLAADPTLLPQ